VAVLGKIDLNALEGAFGLVTFACSNTFIDSIFISIFLLMGVGLTFLFFVGRNIFPN
tara:strand:- start:2065 stop:2235 length:171 start_codon:yes stop_codon:yes gene_type:complete